MTDRDFKMKLKFILKMIFSRPYISRCLFVSFSFQFKFKTQQNTEQKITVYQYKNFLILKFTFIQQNFAWEISDLNSLN